LRVYRHQSGVAVELGDQFFLAHDLPWDRLFHQTDLGRFLEGVIREAERVPSLEPAGILPPVVGQEVWAAGVTYYRSRTARMEESEEAGGQRFYDRVYEAERPELFFKATAHRVVTHGQAVGIRSDSRWNVPEPELTLVISHDGVIQGYTIGNDMSARDIEGENPLYLPQAKVFDRCCSLGPGILVSREPLPPSTEISLSILRGNREVFAGLTNLSAMKRRPQELVRYLFRQNSFPCGCFLLTGTGIVPPSDFTLLDGDLIRISIEPIGLLVNTVKTNLEEDH
jgi:2-dehydro-3-deoxy-D-arabinonate dehydratase